MDENNKRWAAKRKTALVIEMIHGKTTVAEASRSFDLSPSEIEGWVEDAKRGMENSRRAKASTAASALEHALVSRFGTLGKVPRESLPRSDNGLVFTSRRHVALVRSDGLTQEFITPQCPQQNGMVERVIRTLKE